MAPSPGYTTIAVTPKTNNQLVVVCERRRGFAPPQAVVRRHSASLWPVRSQPNPLRRPFLRMEENEIAFGQLVEATPVLARFTEI